MVVQHACQFDICLAVGKHGASAVIERQGVDVELISSGDFTALIADVLSLNIGILGVNHPAIIANVLDLYQGFPCCSRNRAFHHLIVGIKNTRILTIAQITT